MTLAEQLHDGMAAGQRTGTSARAQWVVNGNTERVIERGSQFFGADGFVGRVFAQAVRFTVDVAALNAGTGDD